MELKITIDPVSYSEFMGLELEYVYVVRIPSYTYYKSVNALPDNKEIDSVTFAFRKID